MPENASSEPSVGQRITVAGLGGSLREGSYSRMALNVALAGAASLGADTYLIDLRHYDLPFCDGSGNETEHHPDVQELRMKVRPAHGLILSTPEYHGSFSGVLKNALDLMGFREFEGKMVGLISVSGGSMGGLNGLNSLRAIGRTLHAWVIPDEVSIPRAYQKFTSNGKLKDEDLENRISELGRQVARFSYLHSSKQANEFLKLWEEAPINPGAENR